MPIYVYACQDCSVVEEHIQRFSDPPLTECEHCGGRLEKQVTSAAFHLKGGGWYKDGYASAKGEGSSGEGSGGSDSGSTGSSGGESSSKSSGGESSGKSSGGESSSKSSGDKSSSKSSSSSSKASS